MKDTLTLVILFALFVALGIALYWCAELSERLKLAREECEEYKSENWHLRREAKRDAEHHNELHNEIEALAEALTPFATKTGYFTAKSAEIRRAAYVLGLDGPDDGEEVIAGGVEG